MLTVYQATNDKHKKNSCGIFVIEAGINILVKHNSVFALMKTNYVAELKLK